MGNQHSAREVVHLLVKWRRLVAIAIWALCAAVYTVDFAHNLDAYGTEYLRDWLNVSAFITQPILIALLVFIALRLLAARSSAEGLAGTIMRDAPIGILTCDASGNVTSINRALTKMLNITEPAAAIGQSLFNIPQLSNNPSEEQLRRCLKGEPFSFLDLDYTNAAGIHSYFSAHVLPLREPEGECTGLLVLLEDNSERRQWRAELKHSGEEAERRARELEILQDISMAISSTLDLEEIEQIAYDRISAAMKVNTFYIALFDQASRNLTFDLLIDNGVPGPKFVQHLDQFGGLSGWIIEHKEPLLIDDLQQGPVPVEPGALGSPARSWLGVPLSVQERVIGVMSVQSYAPHQFDAGHLRLLSSIANQISVLIENARLFAHTSARAEELSAANEIALAINTTLDLDKVLNLFFNRLTTLFNVEGGALFLLDPLTNELVFEVVHGGAGDSLVGKRMRSDEGIVGWVVQHGAPLLVPDVQNDPRWFKGIDQDTHYRTRSILAAPIRNQERTIGAVELLNRHDGRSFTEADQKLLVMFAATAGIAIENARLHRQTEKALFDVTTLNIIANQLATTLDLDEILDSIALRLRLIFNSNTCAIHLRDPGTEMLSLQALSGTALESEFSSIPWGSGVIGRAAAERAPIYIQCPDDMPAEAHMDAATQCVLAVPLFSREGVLGTVSLLSEKSFAFSDDDQRLLTTVTAQISTAVENAQLYKDSKERAENLRQAYEELKELDRLKTEFVQNVSHELRTPLTFIKGYVELLTTETFGALSPRIHEGLGTVADKTESLIRLVNDILSLQQAETGNKRADPVNVGLLVRAAIRAADYNAHQANVELVEQIAPDLPQIKGDPDRLMQVFNNLLDNAVKFSSAGSQVCVTVVPQKGRISVQVQDQGIGIASDQHEKIFDRFYQVDGSSTRRFGGTGLGLAIVKEIVQAHKGSVWVESTLGQGSTFFVTLPVAE